MKKISTYVAVILLGIIITACENQNNTNIEESSSAETAIQDAETTTQYEETEQKEDEKETTEKSSEQEMQSQAVNETEAFAQDSDENEQNETTELNISQTNTESETDVTMTNKMNIQIGDTTLTATLENNEAANELKKIIAEEGLTIQFSMYGGFEQVGSIGTSLPTNDVHTSTSAGDIMLYSGNQMVMFYGNHSWAYTRLGKIDASAEELENILGNNDVTAVFTLAE